MGEVVNKKWLTIKKRSKWKSHIGIGVRKNGSSCKAARGEIKFRKKKKKTRYLYLVQFDAKRKFGNTM